MEKVQVKPKLFQRFDQAFCRQVVAEVEAGCRQCQIAQHYGLTPGWVNKWMKRFGSQHYVQAKPRVIWSGLWFWSEPSRSGSAT